MEGQGRPHLGKFGPKEILQRRAVEGDVAHRGDDPQLIGDFTADLHHLFAFGVKILSAQRSGSAETCLKRFDRV